MNYSSLLSSGAKSLAAVLRSQAKDMTITIVIIPPPRQEMWLECGWRHARKRWSWEFEDFEKSQLRLDHWGESCIWNDRVRLHLYMYCVMVIIEITELYNTLIWCLWLQGCIFYRTCFKRPLLHFSHINGLHLFWDTLYKTVILVLIRSTPTTLSTAMLVIYFFSRLIVPTLSFKCTPFPSPTLVKEKVERTITNRKSTAKSLWEEK